MWILPGGCICYKTNKLACEKKKKVFKVFDAVEIDYVNQLSTTVSSTFHVESGQNFKERQTMKFNCEPKALLLRLLFKSFFA